MFTPKKISFQIQKYSFAPEYDFIRQFYFRRYGFLMICLLNDKSYPMKKLLLSGLLLIFYFSGTAQTYTAGTMFPQYTDINPDKLVFYQVTPYTHNTYDLDIFGDSINDIEFIAHGAVSSGGSGAYLAVQPLNPNLSVYFGRLDSVFVPSSGLWNVTEIAKPLNAGDVINNSSAVWEDTLLYMTDHSGSGGGNKNVNDFIGGDKYIGLWYQNGASSWYGWIRVSCVTEDSCYVKDFSYTVGSVGIVEAREQSLRIYPNPSADNFYLEGLDASDVLKLKLTDLTGKDMPLHYTEEGKGLRISTADLPAGCYFLNCMTEHGTLSRKIVKL
jgi:hypothetical protein